MIRTFNIYPFSNFQICQAVLLAIVTVLYMITPWLILKLWVWTFRSPSPIFALSDLFCLAQSPQGSSRLSQMARFPSSYGWVIFHCKHMPHLLYLSSTAGCLSCFLTLNIVNDATVNIGVRISAISVSFSLAKCPEVELLRHMVSLCSFFWAASVLFSVEAALVCNSTNSEWGLPFLRVQTNTCSFLSFWSWSF